MRVLEARANKVACRCKSYQGDQRFGVIPCMPKKKEQKLDIKERNLGQHKALGLYWPESDRIEIDPRLNAREYLYVLIHELTHKTMPEMTEEAVVRVSEVISKGVWQQGFRRIKD